MPSLKVLLSTFFTSLTISLFLCWTLLSRTARVSLSSFLCQRQHQRPSWQFLSQSSGNLSLTPRARLNSSANSAHHSSFFNFHHLIFGSLPLNCFHCHPTDYHSMMLSYSLPWHHLADSYFFKGSTFCKGYVPPSSWSIYSQQPFRSLSQNPPPSVLLHFSS